MWGSQALHPSLWATATLTALSDSLRPTDAISGACSQSPEWGEGGRGSQYNNNIIILKRGYTLYDKTSSVDSRAGDAGRSTREPGVVLRPRRGDV